MKVSKDVRNMSRSTAIESYHSPDSAFSNTDLSFSNTALKLPSTQQQKLDNKDI